MNFIDICSGIGGFRSALENNGHECLAFAEIDKYAKQSYRAIYDTDGEEELDDITTITDEHFRLYRGRCDIITGGFPCQAFSIAGNRRGFDDTGDVLIYGKGNIKNVKFSIEVEEEITEDTVIDNLYKMDEFYEFYSTEYKTIKDVIRHSVFKVKAVYLNDDLTMTLIWRNGKLVE